MKRTFGVIVVVLALGGCTKAADTTAVGADRTVVITMRDNHFEPDRIQVKEGETIQFRFINQGKNRHDAFVGDAKAQAEHEKDARQGRGGHAEHSSGDSEGVILEPGETATLVETFSDESDTLIGCHEPGHYKEGMVVRVSVT